MNKVAFQPLIVSALKEYNAKQFQKDLLAGIIVAIIALPLSIAFAMGAGFTPEKGIWAAIIATLIGSLIGGSRVQISGSTGAFIVITQSVVLQYGKDGLVVAMLLAGVMLILAGVFHLGKYIKFIPAPITTGFTAGIAVSIFTLEVKDFLGLNPESMPVKFIGKWKYYLTSLDETNYYAVILGVIAIVVMFVWPKINRTIPNSFVAIVVGTVLARVFHWDVITLGEMAKSIGTPSVPSMDLQTVMDLVSPAFTIAVLIAMQALLSTVVTDGLINSRSNANHELIAQGISNMILGIFGCVPATGGVARGIASAKNGARTPIAGIVHSLVLLVFLLFFMPCIAIVPKPVLAGVIIIVSYNMFNVKAMWSYHKAPKSDAAVLIASCILTFAFDLVLAIEVGMIMTCLLFMKRMADESEVRGWKYDDGDEDGPDSINRRVVPQHVRVYEINGPMFFGAADLLAEIHLKDFTKVLIIRMRGVPSLDITAMNALSQLQKRCEEAGVTMVLSHVNSQPYRTMLRAGFVDRVGKQNFCKNIDEALAYADTLGETKE